MSPSCVENKKNILRSTSRVKTTNHATHVAFFSLLHFKNWGKSCLFFPFFFFILVVKLNPVQSPLLWHCIPTPGTVSPSNPSNRRWNMAASSALCSDSSRDSPEWWCWVSQTCVVGKQSSSINDGQVKTSLTFSSRDFTLFNFRSSWSKVLSIFFVVVVFVSGIYG